MRCDSTPKQVPTDSQGAHSPAWSALFMLGAFVVGFNLHNVIHELGHATAVWVQGGTVTGFLLHPLDACYNFSTAVPDHILLYAGGAFIGGAATLLFPILAWRQRTPLMLPLVTACAAGLTTSAKHMLVDGAAGFATDYTALIDLGVPASAIVVAGVAYAVVGAAVRILYLPLAGLRHDAGITDRLVVYGLGIAPYFALLAAYAIVAHGVTWPLVVANFLLVLILLSAEALMSRRLQHRLHAFRSVGVQQVAPRHQVAVWVAAAALLVVMRVVSAAAPFGS